MNKETCWITNKGTMANNQWNNDDSDILRTLYSVYKTIRAILFPSLLVNLFKHLNFFKNTMYAHNSFNKAIKPQKKKNTYHTPLHT